jgi:hypothetical protein
MINFLTQYNRINIPPFLGWVQLSTATKKKEENKEKESIHFFQAMIKADCIVLFP